MYDIERIKRWLNSSLLRRVLPLAIVALCLAGTAVMLFWRFDLGLILWFASLVAGALLLYVRRTLEKKLRDLTEEEAQG